MRYIILLILLLTTATALHAHDGDTIDDDFYETHYRYIRVEEEMTAHEFAMTYNICWEQVHLIQWWWNEPPFPSDSEFLLPLDTLPCYNEQGQRLIFNVDGQEALDAPRYTDMPVYVTQEGDTLLAISKQFNVCMRDISYVNAEIFSDRDAGYGKHYLAEHDDSLLNGQELFIPETQSCYDDVDNYLYYKDDGTVEPISPENIAYAGKSVGIRNIQMEYNICETTLQQFNDLPEDNAIGSRVIEILIPPDTPPCFQIIDTPISLHEIELTHNVCREEILNTYANEEGIRTYYIPLAPQQPCYNESGHRLQYYDVDRSRLDEPIRSELDVYIGQASDTLRTITEEHNVCIDDLKRYNPQIFRPYYEIVGAPFFIPDRPCYDALGNRLIYPDNSNDPIIFDGVVHSTTQTEPLLDISIHYNVCVDDILAANPHLDVYQQYNWQWNDMREVVTRDSDVLIPSDSQPCYITYYRDSDEDIYHMAKKFNICVEFLQEYGGSVVPVDYDRCYENGQRLNYYDEEGLLLDEPVRSELSVEIIRQYMTVYELTQRNMVCVDGFYEVNPALPRQSQVTNSILRPDQMVFLPDLGACNHTNSPDYVFHTIRPYQDWASLARTYNVCVNRIVDANVGFLSDAVIVQDEHLPSIEMARWVAPNMWGIGILQAGDVVRIPTDRPPCYSIDRETGEVEYIRYVCYDNPLNLTADNLNATINPDGEYCYPLEDTTVWHEGDKYILQKLTAGYHTPDYLQWCFGAEDIIDSYENPIKWIAPYEELLIKNPTRDCYLRSGEEGKTIHIVQKGETLRDIAMRYGKLPSWITSANGLSDDDLIWEYQHLVIPGGLNLWQLAIGVTGSVPVMLVGLLMMWREQRRRQQAAESKVHFVVI